MAVSGVVLTEQKKDASCKVSALFCERPPSTATAHSRSSQPFLHDDALACCTPPADSASALRMEIAHRPVGQRAAAHRAIPTALAPQLCVCASRRRHLIRGARASSSVAAASTAAAAAADPTMTSSSLDDAPIALPPRSQPPQATPRSTRGANIADDRRSVVEAAAAIAATAAEARARRQRAGNARLNKVKIAPHLFDHARARSSAARLPLVCRSFGNLPASVRRLVCLSSSVIFS